MKIKMFFTVICATLLLCTVTFAAEHTYIVTLRDQVSFFCLAPGYDRDYSVVSEEELKEYLSVELVESYEPNYPVELLGNCWNLDMIESGFAWELGCFGNEVRIGIIDSGIYPFEEIKDNILEGKNYLDSDGDTVDNIGHGTFIAGIIASGSKGIAYNSKLVPLKCFDNGVSTTVGDLLDAIYDAVDVYGCDIINMSLGAASDSSALKRAVNYAVNKGAIVVSAVGNKGSTALYYPAAYDNVVGVGSIGKYKTRSSFSQYNASVTVVAPGESLSSLSIPGYYNNSGTSFATPHVTALAAVAKCADPTMDTEKFMTLLMETSEDLGTSGYDKYYGYGLVNAENLLEKLLENTKIFISPIYLKNGKASAVIYNNSDVERTMTCICAQYDGNERLVTVNPLAKTFLPKEKYVFSDFAQGEKIKYLIWDKLMNMSPITGIKQ